MPLLNFQKVLAHLAGTIAGFHGRLRPGRVNREGRACSGGVAPDLKALPTDQLLPAPARDVIVQGAEYTSRVLGFDL